MCDKRDFTHHVTGIVLSCPYEIPKSLMHTLNNILRLRKAPVSAGTIAIID